jgi:tripartite-type tricarboxylate transporter receptor subunit TctC
VAESGGPLLKGYEASAWFGLLAPAGTPMDIATRVQQETAKAIATPVLKERLQTQGAIPSGMAPDEFARFIDAETKKWAQVVKASGAKVD